VNDRQLYSNLSQTTSALHDTMVHAQAGVTDFQENMEALKHNFLLRGYFKTRLRGFCRAGEERGRTAAARHADEGVYVPRNAAFR